MLEGSALASSPVPFTNYPEKENRRKEKEEIDGGESAEADADHGDLGRGVEVLAGRRSFPHSRVARPQMVSDGAG